VQKYLSELNWTRRTYFGEKFFFLENVLTRVRGNFFSLNLFFAIVFMSNLTFAQSLTNYQFSASSGTFTALTSATDVNVILSDDSISSAIPIGFTFYYVGVPYTNIYASSNGFISFNSSATSEKVNDLKMGSVNLRPLIAPLWDDLDGRATGSKASYKTTGTTGSRVFTFEWLNWEWNADANSPTISFQVKLYEANGKIEFIYKQESGVIVNASASIGITSSGLNSFFSLDGTGTNPNVSSETNYSALNTKPATGQVYTFTPAYTTAPANPINLTFNSVTYNSMTLNWKDNSTNETFFRVYRTMDLPNFVEVGIVQSTTTSTTGTSYMISQTGLMPGTTYYYKIVACNEGVPPGSGLNGSQATTSGSTITSAGSGNWTSNTPNAPWPGGVVPTLNDNVVISAGHTIIVDDYAYCNNITIGGTLQFTNVYTSRTLTAKDFTINSGGSVNLNNIVTGGCSHSIIMNGNLVVNGTMNLFVDMSKYVSVYFRRDGNTTITGSPTLCKFGIISVELKNSLFTIQPSFKVVAGYMLALTKGIWQQTTDSLIVNGFFSCSANSKLNVSNTAVVIDKGATSSGDLSITGGSFSVGMLNANSDFNLSGNPIVKFENTSVFVGDALIAKDMTGGSLQILGTTTIELASRDEASGDTTKFYLSPKSNLSFSNGTLRIKRSHSSTASTFYLPANCGSITGGTIHIDNAATNASLDYNIDSQIPFYNFTINASGRNVYLKNNSLVVNNNFTLNSGTFSLNGLGLNISQNFTNNGTINASVSKSILTFSGLRYSVLSVGGIFTSNQIANLIVNTNYGISFVPNIQITEGITMLLGAVSWSGTLTLGKGSSGTFNFIMGNGYLNGTPTYSYTSMTVNYTYQGTQEQYTNNLPSNISGRLTIDNPAGVVLWSAAQVGSLTLNQGKLTTTSTNLLTITASSSTSLSRVDGYINGPFTRYLAANLDGSIPYLFPVGKGSYNPVELTNPVTTSSGTVRLRVEVFDASCGGTAGTGLNAINTNRYWQISFVSGNANFTSSKVKFTDNTISYNNLIGKCETQNGSYISVGGTVSGETILSNSITSFSYFVIGSKALLSAGTYQVGASRTYANLTTVAQELKDKTLSGNIIFELQSDYDGTSGETFPITFNKFGTQGGNWSVTIRPANGVSTRSTIGTPGVSQPLISFAGCDRITFDGRPGGTGTSIGWIIRNSRSSSGTPVFSLTDDACNNELKFLQIESQVAEASGSVFIGMGSQNGNDSNTISNCNIRNRGDAVTYQYSGIYSSGINGKNNDGNTIINNNIFNFMNSAIYISPFGNGNGWTISGNSIYNDGTNGSAIPSFGINFNASDSSANNIISNNYIGGQSPNCGGSAFTNPTTSIFTPIAFNGNPEITSTIQGNIIKNIAMTSSSGGGFRGIQIEKGLINFSDNVIGSVSSAEISVAGTGFVYAVILGYNVKGTIKNNTIGKINLTSATPGGYAGIYNSSIFDNVTEANKILIQVPSSGTSNIYGIQLATDSTTGFTQTIVNNQITLIKNSTTANFCRGIINVSKPGNNYNIYYNSVLLTGTQSTGSSYAYLKEDDSNVILRNNILFNNITNSGTALPLAIGVTVTNGSFNSNYNFLVSTSASTIGNWNNVSSKTFSSWKSNSGQDNSSWSINVTSTWLLNFFSSYAAGDLNIIPTNQESWYVNGKALPLAGYKNDFSASSVRSDSIYKGSADIGSDEFTPTVNPPNATASGTIAVGYSTIFELGGRTIATIQWTGGTSLPTAVTLTYFSGKNPPNPLNGNYSNAYWKILPTGGTNYTCTVTFYYDEAIMGKVSYESKMKISKKDALSWKYYSSAIVDSNSNYIYLSNITSFSDFALTDNVKSLQNIAIGIFAFLQGPYNTTSGVMDTLLRSYVPLSHPYNTSPWGYSGTEQVTSLPSGIVDWILLELRSDLNTTVGRRAAFIKNNGEIVDIDGVSKVGFYDLAEGNYYIVIKHRNHLGVMSVAPVPIGGSTNSSFDFRSTQTQAYGTNPMKTMSDGKCCLYSGDGNASGTISSTDRNAVWRPQNGQSGYLMGDFNLSGGISAADRNNHWRINNGVNTQVP